MLGRLFSRPTEERSAPFVVQASNGWWGWTQGSGAEALFNDAVWAGTDVLCGEVSKLPVDVVRSQGVRRAPVSPTPSLIAEPSGVVTQDVWVYQLVWSMVHDGNGFGLVTQTDSRGFPTMVELVDHSIVTERDVVDGVKQAKVDSKVHRAFPFGDLVHVPGKMVRSGSPFGLSPVEHAAGAIATGLSAGDFGLRFFTDDGHPMKVVYSDKELTQPQAEQVKAALMGATRGNREPVVMGSGLKLAESPESKTEPLFIDLQRFTTEQVCRFLGVPPSMVYAAVSGQNVTYANVSQADLHFLKHSLEGYLVRIEQALTRLLPRPQFVRFNRNALLRSDAEGRNSVYDTRLRNRTLSVNEVRALEDEEPFADPAFDEPGIPGDPPAPAATEPEEGE